MNRHDIPTVTSHANPRLTLQFLISSQVESKVPSNIPLRGDRPRSGLNLVAGLSSR